MDTNLNEITFPETPFPLLEHILLIGNRGSQAHGTYIANTDPNSIDDRDLMVIAIPPLDYYFGTKHWESAEGIFDPWDTVIYEFKKFIGLLTKQNPNVLMMLWLEKEDYYYIHHLGQRLINSRHMFCSRESLDTFVGYAKGQLTRMTAIAGRGYLGAKRKKLVEKYGYDCKNAAHLLRLLHTGIEFLNSGNLNVKRTWDRELLINVKTGKYCLTEVNAMAAAAFEQIEEVAKKSPLPKRLDMKEINKLCLYIMEEWFEEHK